MRNYQLSELKCHLSVTLSEINLDKILATGQVFRWRKKDDTWFGVIRSKLWILRQDSTGIHYSFHDIVTDCETKSEFLLRDYFNLNHKLADITTSWLSSDPHLNSLISSNPGLRLIRQHPFECLLAFITSSCNNMPRIASLMLKLSQISEHHISVDGTDFYTLPSISQLRKEGTEQVLRGLGFGYRAKYIVSAMQHVDEKGGEKWLESLRNVELTVARKELSLLAGVGPKVASCVCLMSLDKHSAVPIDTHMFQVAVKYYGRQNKSLTPALHQSIEQFFQSKHGSYAGWAQNYLFYSNSNKDDISLKNGNKTNLAVLNSKKKRYAELKESPKTKNKKSNLDKENDLDIPQAISKIGKVS